MSRGFRILLSSGFTLILIGCAVLNRWDQVFGAAVGIETRYIVTIQNKSAHPLVNAKITGGGCDTELGTIEGGLTVSRSLTFQHDDHLELQFVDGANSKKVVIEGYVTGCLAGQTAVTINPDQTITISNRYR